MLSNMCDVSITLCVFAVHRPLKEQVGLRLLETTVLGCRGIFTFSGELLQEVYKAHTMQGCSRDFSEVRDSDCALDRSTQVEVSKAGQWDH